MATSMQLQPAEVYFAQKLAANEKKIRDRAVKKLRKYIAVRSQSAGFSEDDMLKIWKGLHYCMWMCDKALVQEDLADTLSNLLQCFSNNNQAFLFIEIFFRTECREWFGIDRLRLDKFMMLIRRVLRQCLTMLKMKKWKLDLVKRFLSILDKYVISNSEDAGPDGLKFHISDIYLDELGRVGGDSLKPETLQIFLQPYCTMLTQCENKYLASHVIKRIFENIIDQSDVGREEEEDEDEEADDKDKTPKLQFDYDAIADNLFDLAKGKDCLARNRPVIYNLVKKFKDLAAGIFPSDDVTGSGDEDEPISNQDMFFALQRLQKVEKLGIKKKLKKKRKLETAEKDSEEGPKKKKSKEGKLADKNQINGSVGQNPSKKRNKYKLDQQDKLKNEVQENSENGDLSPGESVDVNETENDNVSKKNNKKKKNASLQKDDSADNAGVPAKKMKKDGSLQAMGVCETGEEGQGSVKKGKKKKVKNSDALLEDQSCPSQQQDGGKDEKGAAMNISSDSSNEENSATKKKNKKKKLPVTENNKSCCPLETCIENTSDLPKQGNDMDSVKVKNKKNKNVKDSPKSATLKGGENEESVTSENEMTKAKETSRVSEIKTTNCKTQNKDISMESKETVINISPKKKKKSLGNEDITLTLQVKGQEKKLKADASPPPTGTPFASFENGYKTPPMFIRKAVSKNKRTPKTEPRNSKRTLVTPAPEAPSSEGKKRVSFIMSRNKAQEFKESLTPSPAPVFNPQKLPEQGILKTPPSGGAIYKRTRSAVKAKRAKAADFF